MVGLHAAAQDTFAAFQGNRWHRECDLVERAGEVAAADDPDVAFKSGGRTRGANEGAHLTGRTDTNSCLRQRDARVDDVRLDKDTPHRFSPGGVQDCRWSPS